MAGQRVLRRQDQHRAAPEGQVTLVPLLITTACYVWVAVGFWMQGNTGLAVAFAGYSVANLGFLYICIAGQP